MIRRKRLVAAVTGLALILGSLAAISWASEPASQSATVPGSPGKTTTIKWTGSIPPGSNPNSDCNLGVNEDVHEVEIKGANYADKNATFTFTITWEPNGGSGQTSDEILTVIKPDGTEVGSSDGGSPSESVSGANLTNGKYKVVACGFVNGAPQAYDGKLVITTEAKGSEASLPSAPARGLKFSASVPADLQRDEGEPLIEIDKAGRTYTCGPTGFSQAADYAQVSTDGGDQFHILGAPPRGQQGTGGGGDCAMATSPDANAVEVDDQKTYNYSYTGLGPLTGFTTATSPDGGHTLASSPDNGSIPGVDRQWQVFLDKDTVLLNYNRQAPRSVEVIKSTNGGLTYNPPNGTNAETTPTSVTFPGPLRALDAKFNWTGAANGRVAYFPWTSGLDEGGYAVNLAVSTDMGDTWKLCLAAKLKSDPSQSFPVADHDNEGNIYLTYTTDGKFHTYLQTLKYKNLKKCGQPSGEQPTSNPGFSTPLQVDRDKVRTTLFPWLVASGKPGRVTVMMVATKSDGNPNQGAFQASWNMYANQSLNALSKDRTFSQVKATSHPFHFDSICLNGLGCDISGGDRSLADFFAIDYNPKTHGTAIVYVRANKRPGEAEGHIASPIVTRQIAGPSNGGGTVDIAGRKPTRSSSTDATGDALSNYSNFGATPATQNEKAADFLSAKILDPVDPATGKPSKDGGFTLKMKLADLSDAALQDALLNTGGKSLVWIYHFTNGYQDGGAVVSYNPAGGFSFGFNDYTLPPKGECGPSDSDKCVVYPGDKPVPGKVNQKKGVIKLTVPLKYLKTLKGSEGDGQRPKEVPAQPRSKLYDGTAFSVANVLSPTQDVQSFMYPLDNTPAMDFRVPGASVRNPLVKTSFSDKTPKRGTKVRFGARLAACKHFPKDKSKLAGTKIKFQKRKGGKWVTIASKRTNKQCKAHVAFRANFKKRKFRALWKAQVKGYAPGHSTVRRLRTH